MKVLHVFTLFSTAYSFFDGQFRYLADHGYDLHLICSNDNKANDFIQRNKLKYHPVEISRSITPVKDILAIYNTCRYIHKEQIDVVVGHTPKGALVAMLAAFVMRIPHRVYYRHGVIYTTAKGLKRFILKKEEQFVSLLSNKIINVSKSLGALAIEDRLNCVCKQAVIGKGTCGGIDAWHKYNPDTLNLSILNNLKMQLGLKPNDLVIGFCGRICKDKGIVELLDGYNLFKSNHPELSVKLLLIGDYDTRDILSSALTDELTHNSGIIFTGFIHENIEYYYQLMDIFVLPSYREGFGMSVLEASAMQKPILVSCSHGCVDSIRENETGYYIDISPTGISDGISRLTDPEIRKILGGQGRKFVLDNYDHTKLWPEILEFYKTL